MASLRGNHLLDLPAHFQRQTAIDLSKVDTSDPWASGPDWTTSLMKGIFGTGGLDPAEIRKAKEQDTLKDKYKHQIEGADGVWQPGKSKGQYESQLIDLEQARKKALAQEALVDKLKIIAKGNEPQIAATKAGTAATLANTAAQKEIAMAQLLSGDKNAAAERLARLQMAQDADLRAQQQWARQMEYEDKKSAAAKEEKALEALIAGLISLGMGFA